MTVACDRTLSSPADRLTQGPVLPLILSLALPNMVAMVSAAAVSIAETAYVGALGRDALAAILASPYFLYRIESGNPVTHALTDVELASGDLFVFGGPTRFAYHGVPKVYPGTADHATGMSDGRLNITLRETGLSGP